MDDYVAQKKRSKPGGDSDVEDNKFVRKQTAKPTWSFVPDEGIEVECLVFYVKEYIDHQANFRPGPHWEDKSSFGYWIESRCTLSGNDILAIKLDTRDWKREKVRSRNVTYNSSKTAASRRKAGAAESVRYPRIPEETTADVQTTAKEVVAKRHDPAEANPPIIEQTEAAANHRKAGATESVHYPKTLEGTTAQFQIAAKETVARRHDPPEANHPTFQQSEATSTFRVAAPYKDPYSNPSTSPPVARSFINVTKQQSFVVKSDPGRGMTSDYGVMPPVPSDQGEYGSGMAERSDRHKVDRADSYSRTTYQQAGDGRTPPPTRPQQPGGEGGKGQPGWQRRTFQDN